MDDEQIKADFNALYQAMNGLTLREMDKVIHPVGTLCRDHEKAGFVAGIKIGGLMQSKMSENISSTIRVDGAADILKW